MSVVGARPNFVKAAALIAAFREARIEPLLVHTGQHYDDAMSARFFRELGLPAPDFNLEVGSGSHAVQTADAMKAFEPVVLDVQPDLVLVVGDVNSTLAAGLVAAKLGVPLAHVEAGLRSGDRSMPEEINRIVTDAVSDTLFCTEQAAVDNLVREGIAPEKVFLAGNTMVDTLLRHRARAQASAVLDDLGLEPGQYAAVTLHRPSNVDDPATLAQIIGALDQIRRRQTVVLTLHPRLRDNLSRFGFDLENRAANTGREVASGRTPAAKHRLVVADPFGYLDFLKLADNAQIVLTDSGGVQEETTVLGVPCLTLRKNTERPETIRTGTNRLAGVTTDSILAAYRAAIQNPPQGSVPPYWDGRAAERIAETLLTRFADGRTPVAPELPEL